LFAAVATGIGCANDFAMPPPSGEIPNMHRQFEFLIRFSNFNRRDLARCIDKLPRRPDARAGQPHFELRLEPDGFYFHDLARSAFSARMLRVVLELALEHSEVQLEGFGSGQGDAGGGRPPISGSAEFDKLLKNYRLRALPPGLGGANESSTRSELEA
jgi:hypothetical protein